MDVLLIMLGMMIMFIGTAAILQWLLPESNNKQNPPTTQHRQIGIDYSLVQTLDHYNRTRNGIKISSQDQRKSERPENLL